MAETDTILSDLTPKELAVFDLLSKGYDNPKIAETLNCKVSTVTQDVNRLYSKLELGGDLKGTNKRVAAARIYLMANSQLSNDVATG